MSEAGIQLPNKQLLRVDEVAAILHCSTRMVRYHIEWGRLEAVRLRPRFQMVTRESVERMVRLAGEESA